VTWNERIDLRHRKRKIFENSDDPRLKRAVIAGYDLHYDDGQGAWQECVEGYETSDVVGYTQMARRLRHALHVANNGGRRWYPRRNVPGEYIQFGRLQYWNGTSWVNVPFGTPVVTNNSIFWDHALFSLTLRTNWHRIKIEAVLKSSGAARPLRWAVSLVGLTWNNWQLSGQDNEIVAHVDAPQGWDANGSQEEPNIAVTASYAGGFIRFDADLSAAVYPVTVDPTLTLQDNDTTAIDTYVSQVAATTNYGTATTIRFCDGSANDYSGLLKFDCSSIASGSTCDDATLSFKVWNPGLDDTIYVYSILSANSDWTEAGATWNTKDGSNNWAGGNTGCQTSGTDRSASSIGSITFVSASDAYGTVKSTALTAATVETWFGGSNTNYGIVMHVTSPAFADATVASSGTFEEASFRPKLVVNYTEAGGGNPWYAWQQM